MLTSYRVCFKRRPVMVCGLGHGKSNALAHLPVRGPSGKVHA